MKCSARGVPEGGKGLGCSWGNKGECAVPAGEGGLCLSSMGGSQHHPPANPIPALSLSRQQLPSSQCLCPGWVLFPCACQGKR